MLPIALAIEHEPLATALWQYKDLAKYRDVLTRVDEARQAWATESLQALIDLFMPQHERCLAQAAAASGFDAITWIPSSRGRPGQHPVKRLLVGTKWASGRCVEMLRPSEQQVPPHEAHSDKFAVTTAVAGAIVLLFDDRWTRGANAFSAARALYNAGAATVAVGVVGRHFVPGYQDGHIFADEARKHDFAPETCLLCDRGPVASPILPSRGQGQPTRAIGVCANCHTALPLTGTCDYC